VSPTAEPAPKKTAAAARAHVCVPGVAHHHSGVVAPIYCRICAPYRTVVQEIAQGHQLLLINCHAQRIQARMVGSQEGAAEILAAARGFDCKGAQEVHKPMLCASLKQGVENVGGGAAVLQAVGKACHLLRVEPGGQAMAAVEAGQQKEAFAPWAPCCGCRLRWPRQLAQQCQGRLLLTSVHQPQQRGRRRGSRCGGKPRPQRGERHRMPPAVPLAHHRGLSHRHRTRGERAIKK
jgi:hypothetical protein